MIDKDKLTTPFQTYIALIKGFSTLSVMMIPKAFQTGGVFISPVIETTLCTILGFCAFKLVECGERLKIYNYGELVL